MRVRLWATALIVGLIGTTALATPVQAAAAAPAHHHHHHQHHRTVHIVCATEGGSLRYFVAFTVSRHHRPAERPAVNSAPVTVWGKTAHNGWEALNQPTWTRAGSLATSLYPQQAQHGAISEIKIYFDGRRSQTVPVKYTEDCSYAGLPF